MERWQLKQLQQLPLEIKIQKSRTSKYYFSNGHLNNIICYNCK